MFVLLVVSGALPTLASNDQRQKIYISNILSVPHDGVKGARHGKNTGNSKWIGLVKDRYQKENSCVGLWDKYNRRGDYVGTKKSGGPFKSIRLLGRNPKRGRAQSARLQVSLPNHQE